MRKLYLIHLSILILLIGYYVYSTIDSDEGVTGSFKETCRAGTRLRSFKKDIDSTWDSRGIAKLFNSLNIEKTQGKPVDSISIKTTSQEDFNSKYLHVNKPCIIRDIPTDWIAMKKWSVVNFLERFGKCKFRVTGNDNSLKYEYFHHYVNDPRHRQDDEPIFIFDSTFADKGKKMRELLDEYEIPEWFRDDLFNCLDEDERPNFRWLLISTRRAGTSLHIDPVATCAWNTMIQGKKRWILFPPDTFKSEDDFDAGIRGAEWFIKEYPKYKHLPHNDFIQNPGETIFLPSNWWHITVNLEDSIAITQNLLTHNNFKKAIEVCYDSLPKVYIKWIRLLNEQMETDPDLLVKMGGKIQDLRTVQTIDYSSDAWESESDVE
jgi:histone arginine demethylase JMJD6|tara:strand:+ start:4141 stop:5271 length:1131 start_codon:yes stop_codon:yes gene_type:complete